MGTSLARKEDFNKTSVNNFLNLLGAAFDEHSYPPERFYNVDE